MWYNPIMQWLLRSPLHLTISKNTMLMTYTGRKSGKQYTTPINYLENGGALYAISSRDRLWWRNLRGGADVTLRLKGEDVPAWADSVEDHTEVVKGLSLYLKTAPNQARYMNIRLDEGGIPDADDIARLSQEKVIVTTKLK